MARPTDPPKAMLVIGIMYNDDKALASALIKLEEEFGSISSRSKTFEFDFTDYYDDEMGQNLKKIYVSFKRLINPSRLPSIKLLTNSIEDSMREGDTRKINLDPGYLTKYKLIVASCKPMYHRIYLDKGVYAHLMFFFSKDQAKSFSWTFPDYEACRSYFLDLKNKL